MRLPTPRQWTAIALAAVALPALTYTAWPLVPFLTGLLPEALPVGRILWGLLFAAVLAAAVGLARPFSKSPELGWLILLAWAVAIAAVTGIVLIVWLILGFPGLEEVPQLSPKDLDAIATRAFAIVAGLGGVALLVISYRRQRTTENGEERESTKLFTERFTTASEQLGSEHAAVRLAGVHALARLADDAPQGREDLVQMVIDVLCAYLRMPYRPAPEPLPKNAAKTRREEHRERELEFAAFREVRYTILRIIGSRLREDTRWRGHDFIFTGAVFDGCDFTGAHFTGGRVSFHGAQFPDKTYFREARFAGGTVDFRQAHFSGERVHFGSTWFTGATVDFRHAQFTGSTHFGRAQFTGGKVSFSGVDFSEGHTHFNAARFAGGTVEFSGAKFAGASVGFGGSQFTGGRVDFGHARFLDGKVSFDRAEFTGSQVNFAPARFSGRDVSFNGAVFSGGWVSFAGDPDAKPYPLLAASGTRPVGLATAVASGVPGVVLLPPEWMAPDAAPVTE